TRVNDVPRLSSTHFSLRRPSLMMSMIWGMVYLRPFWVMTLKVPDGALEEMKSRPVLSVSHSKTAGQGLPRISKVYAFGSGTAFLVSVGSFLVCARPWERPHRSSPKARTVPGR